MLIAETGALPRLPHKALSNTLRVGAVLSLAGLLSGCGMVVMHPAGDVAVQQRNLILASVGLMLLIILPVIALTLLFAWHYRAANREATYDPDWHHSTALEVVIWTAPLIIIIALGALTWISTHTLDPYRKISRIDAKTPVPAGVKPLTVEVVALDWKWMFFLPDQGIATVNELAAPVDVPINFKLTSASVMNSFFIPALAGQIYAMPGMETKLHAVINKAGTYEGFSANYSGSGFTKMNFKFNGLSQTDFDAWVAKVKAEGKPIDRQGFLDLEKPSEAVAPRYYSSVEPGLYSAILNMCVRAGKMCMHEMMTIDRAGGGGIESHANQERLRHDDRFGPTAYDGFGHGSHGGPEAPGATVPDSGRAPRSDQPAQHNH